MQPALADMNGEAVMAKDYDNEFDHMEQDVLDDSGFVTDDIPEEEENK